MYIVACAPLLHWGEISLQSLGSKRPLMLHGFCHSMGMVMRDVALNRQVLQSQNVYDNGNHEEAGEFLGSTDARIHST